jgi:uncharacterized phage protein (TIGR01671 family)
MREIKFRAWDAEQKKLFSGDDIEENYDELTLYLSYGALHITWFPKNGDDARNLLVEQYIGLKDKNGRKAYFGDLVKTRIGPLDYIRPIYALDNGCPVIDLPTIDSNTDKPMILFNLNTEEVIGNMHENPELINANTD